MISDLSVFKVYHGFFNKGLQKYSCRDILTGQIFLDHICNMMEYLPLIIPT